MRSKGEACYPKRKDPRLKGFDYGAPGAYFLTICTHNKAQILSAIVGEGFPLPQLSKCGQIVDDLLHQIPKKYPSVSVDCYVVMPNHIHLLLSICQNDGRGDPSPTVDVVMGWFKFQATKAINQARGTPGHKVFQRSFFDHVIRGQRDYDEIFKYICENPMCWRQDAFFETKSR